MVSLGFEESHHRLPFGYRQPFIKRTHAPQTFVQAAMAQQQQQQQQQQQPSEEVAEDVVVEKSDSGTYDISPDEKAAATRAARVSADHYLEGSYATAVESHTSSAV